MSQTIQTNGGDLKLNGKKYCHLSLISIYKDYRNVLMLISGLFIDP